MEMGKELIISTMEIVKKDCEKMVKWISNLLL